MNYTALHQLVNLYKLHFEEINGKEIYKWRAIQNFKINWNIDAQDFPVMLEASLSNAFNLLDSNKYFPKRMIVEFARAEPVAVKTCFEYLFDESFDLDLRIAHFQETTKNIFNEHFADRRNYYQDQRAVLVYLNFMYPEQYFLYKFGMFEYISEMLGYHYKPKRNHPHNPYHFANLCRLVLEEIKRDNDLLVMHQQRLDAQCYSDPAFHVLTQDIIYAANVHLPQFATEADAPFIFSETNLTVQAVKKEHTSTGRFIDYLARQAAATQLGKIGEEYVFQRECTLIGTYYLGQANVPEHSSVVHGDGLGYDILSYSSSGMKKYIEVKTTRGDLNTPLYITDTELKASIALKDNYYLYRVYNFDEERGTADILVIRGSLEPYCKWPSQYWVSLREF